MRVSWINAFSLGIALAFGASAVDAQTDTALSAYRSFNYASTGNGTQQTPSDSIGGMVELSHIQNPFLGYEVTYSYNRNNQTYAPISGSCGFFCSNGTLVQPAYQNEVGLDWIFSMKAASFRPFAVAGAGFMITVPSTIGYALNTIVRPAYIYGGGVDWGGQRFGLRLQYRGNYYHTPDLSGVYPTTGKFTQTAEPMAGIYYRISGPSAK